MTEEAWKQLATNIGSVCGIVISILALCALIALFIYSIIYWAKTRELKRKYRNSLPEHERYIIHEYEAIEWKPNFKKVRKNNDYH